MFGEQQIVVAQKNDMLTSRCVSDEVYPPLEQGLALRVGRMRLACNDELHRVRGVRQQAQQALRIVQQQVRPFVGSKAARESQRQCIGIEQFVAPHAASSGDAPEAASWRDRRSRA